MMRYLFIFEDGSITMCDSIPNDVKRGWRDGTYSIIIDTKNWLELSFAEFWVPIDEHNVN